MSLRSRFCGLNGYETIDKVLSIAAGMPVIFAINSHRGSHFSFSQARK